LITYIIRGGDFSEGNSSVGESQHGMEMCASSPLGKSPEDFSRVCSWAG